MNELTDSLKAIQLRKHKVIATGLFLLMAIIYIVCTWLLKTQNQLWVGYVKAFAEAAMIGALADWFAVTALFHHPLGIKIPHTNLIENKKKSIGDNLGGFVVSNFLNAPTIRPYIQKLNISNALTNWLSKEKNINALVSELSYILKNVIQKADDDSLTRFITQKSKELLKEIKLNEVVASGLDIVIERKDHVRILNFFVNRLRSYIIDNEEMIRARVKKESHFLIPGFVDNIIASKITNGLSNYLTEIENDASHNIRNEIYSQLGKFINDIRTSPKWQRELQELKDSILAGDKVQQYATSVWKHLQAGIIKDIEADSSAIRQYLLKAINEMATNLKQDPAIQKKINNWLRYNAYKYTLRNATKVGELISSTVGDWQGKELSNKLELEVGKDLQYIRINGTIVGGLVGLIIYTITRWIEIF